MKYVFWNEIKPDEDSGGAPVEAEFQELWHKLIVPADADLLKSLAAGASISPTLYTLARTNRASTLLQRDCRLQRGRLSSPRDL